MDLHNCIQYGYKYITIHMNLDFKGKQGNEPESPLSIFIDFHRKKGCSGGIRTHKLLLLNPRPPAFKAVALPTEPPRQPNWLGSNHTSYARQSVKLALINRVNSNSISRS